MRHSLYLLFFGILLCISCGNDNLNVMIAGEVKGLKKGTLFLERLEDTTVVVLDSVNILGDPNFQFNIALAEPEVLYLSLDANSNEEPRVAFFADSGLTTINTTLKRFYHDAKIEGSEEQTLWNRHKEMLSNFNNENLDLIKSEFEFAEDSVKVDSIKQLRERNFVRRYQYTINFAKTNSNSALAPYILLTEVSDANISYLDTVYEALTPEVAETKYGKSLKEFIDSNKKE